jgi:hypothetical protein
LYRCSSSVVAGATTLEIEKWWCGIEVLTAPYETKGLSQWQFCAM